MDEHGFAKKECHLKVIKPFVTCDLFIRETNSQIESIIYLVLYLYREIVLTQRRLKADFLGTHQNTAVSQYKQHKTLGGLRKLEKGPEILKLLPW